MSSRWSDLIPRPRSKFVRVRCPDCGNEQVTFQKVSSIVKCNVCDGLLAEPTGGKAKFRGEIIAELE
ncbi:30S ribosomal protein S27e [Candidatus Bathyarchaeota archaeon]|nr:30S ribosomal protein S27e [Candidatus Bathyarchaeota archaeon]